MNAAVDFSSFKQNELDHQDKRYGRARPVAYDKESFARDFLLPAHKGGTSRGELYARAFARRPSGRILDYACGKGHLAIRLAMDENDVCAFDVSPEGIRVASEQACLSGVNVDFRVMDAEHLDYDDESFDGVIGFEALHHVIIYPGMARELSRVMKPGARAVFAENWGGDNALFEIWRRNTSLKRHNSWNRGEVILSQPLLDEYLSDYFEIDVETFSLTYMAKKYVHSRGVCASLYALDKVLLALPLNDFCGESVITLTKR